VHVGDLPGEVKRLSCTKMAWGLLCGGVEWKMGVEIFFILNLCFKPPLILFGQ